MIFSYKGGSFDLNKKTYIMGIINVTPDSFFDGGKYKSIDDIIYTAENMAKYGVDILDVGGESTRPGFSTVSVEEELSRTIPVIKSLHQHFSIPVSIDTTKSEVAKEALKHGAVIVNDIWGAQSDSNMLNIVKDYKAGIIIGHNRTYKGNPKTIFSELDIFFKNVIDQATKLEIPYSFLCIDPNIGFAKTYEENIEIIRHLSRLSKFKLPILIGVSRKSIIGQTLDLPPSERLEGSLALAVIAAIKGANFLRVHDVKETARALKMTDKIFRSVSYV